MKKIKFLNIYESDKKIVPFLLRKINKNIINSEFILDKDVKKILGYKMNLEKLTLLIIWYDVI